MTGLEIDTVGAVVSLGGGLSTVTETLAVKRFRGATAGASPTGTSGLYFELRVDGQPVDPLQWLKKK